ncbi:hypothetical protein [Frankia sp. AgB32]|nr:hypothetical protein [Frankia sp. AgB32]
MTSLSPLSRAQRRLSGKQGSGGPVDAYMSHGRDVVAPVGAE